MMNTVTDEELLKLYTQIAVCRLGFNPTIKGIKSKTEFKKAA